MPSLYIHIPFCKNKCRYCGFYSETIENYTEQYISAIFRDLDRSEYSQFETIYIGGGTPSVISEDNLEKLLKKISEINKITPLEFSFEANPESLTKGKIGILKDYGVSRISLGVQSLDDDVLKFLGRIHTSKDVFKVIEYINNCGIFQINCDLMYDIPRIEKDKVLSTLKELVKLPIHHVSAYNYSFDTDFMKEFKDVDQKTLFYEVKGVLEDSGFHQYEISNFAKSGFHSKHNMKYWKMEEYIGIGISAHSMLYDGKDRIRFANEGDILSFIKNEHSIVKETIALEDQIIEDIVFGLRMNEGVNIISLSDKYFYNMDNFLKNMYNLFQEGLLEIRGENLCLTNYGQLFLDYVQQYLWDLFYL
ncbi:MAG: radical SAM family heme chaperone HemW [Calditerrivibrio sp.]|nr:radical SAM family heme chaperone HemW [Calditerrivibrio sp.]